MNKRDYFISFTWADEGIATAINDALRTAGFTTWFHPADRPKGAGIADWMETALDASVQMLALCSDSYFDREKGYSRAERQSMFWEDSTNNEPLLILVKVAECTFPRLIAQNEYIDLIGLQRPEAAAKLLGELQGEQARIAHKKAEEENRSRAQPALFNVQGSLNPLFTGRDAELTLLHDRVKSGNATAITAVQGMGGIGKTSLVREYAHRFGSAARFGGVWWIDAETQSGILAGYDQLAEQLGGAVPRDADQEKTAEAMCNWLGQQPDSSPWLVIFDNAREAITVAKWLPKGSAKVIITSRYGGFDTIADLLPLDFWDRETTAKFLQKRTGRGSDDATLSLAERLDGLPLAAEQAGAYLRENATLSFKAYEDRLIQMLDRAPESLPGGYDKSLYATFRTALEAVVEQTHGEAALGILKLCAFLSSDGVDLGLLRSYAEKTEVNPATLRETLLDEVQCAEAIATLTNYSLIRLGEVPVWGQTLILHRLLGDIVREMMGQEARVQWGGVAVQMVKHLMLDAAVSEPHHWPICARLTPHVAAMLPFETLPAATGTALAFVLNQTGIYLSVRGDDTGAIILLRRQLEILENLEKDDPHLLAIALDNLAGRLEKQESTRDEAGTMYVRALDIKQAFLPPNDPSIAMTLSNMSWIPWQKKDFAKAVELISRAAKITKAAYGTMSTDYARCLSNLGAIYCDWAKATNDPQLATKERDAKQEAVQISRALRGMRHPEMANREHNLAIMHSDCENSSKAAGHMARSVAISLSLDQLTHPQTVDCIAHLLMYWDKSNQSEKTSRLSNGDFSDIVPIVEQIEAEHRTWVAEDPDNREFGPRSPITDATE